MRKKSKIKNGVLILFCFIFIFLIFLLFSALHIPTIVNKDTITRSRLKCLSVAMICYSEYYKSYPEGDSLSVLNSLRGLKNDKRRRVYLEIDSPKKTFYGTDLYSKPFDENGNYLDAWGRIIVFFIDDGKILKLKSNGANGIPNDEDDIVEEVEIKKFISVGR